MSRRDGKYLGQENGPTAEQPYCPKCGSMLLGLIYREGKDVEDYPNVCASCGHIWTED